MVRPAAATWTSALVLSALILPPLIALMVHAGAGAPPDAPGVIELAGPRRLRLLARSVLLALSAGGLGTLFGLAAGYAVALQPPARQPAWALGLLTPLLIPPFIHALSWIIGAELLHLSCHGFVPAVLVLSLAFFPLAGLVSWLGIHQIRRLQEPAFLAQPRAMVLARIEIPLLLPYLATAFLAISLFSFSDYGVASLFRVNTYPVTVFAQFAAHYDVRAALAAGWPYLLLPVPALILWQSWARPRVLEATGRLHGGARPTPSRTRLRVGALVFTVLLLAGGVLPLAMQILRAGPPATYLTAWRTAHAQLTTSLLLAGASASALVLVALAALPGFRTRGTVSRAVVDYLSLFPLVVPGTVFGIGMIVLWNRPATQWIYGTAVGVCLLYIVRFLPFALRPLVARWETLPKAWLDAAALVDAPAPRRFTRIVLPALAPALVIGWVLAFALALRELSGTLLLIPPGIEPLSVRIYSLYHYGAGRLVAALSIFMVFTTWLVIAGAGWLVRRTVRWSRSPD